VCRITGFRISMPRIESSKIRIPGSDTGRPPGVAAGDFRPPPGGFDSGQMSRTGPPSPPRRVRGWYGDFLRLINRLSSPRGVRFQEPCRVMIPSRKGGSPRNFFSLQSPWIKGGGGSMMLFRSLVKRHWEKNLPGLGGTAREGERPVRPGGRV
jgi:hypothetical protein